VRGLAARVVAVIRIDTLWLCTQPQDMRAGADRLLSTVVNTVGAAHAHHGYIFANLRATRIKLLVHDGFGVWCATRRLHAGRFVWLQQVPGQAAAATLQLTAQQFEALVVGLPWQRLGEFSVISRS
jgi:transposase